MARNGPLAGLSWLQLVAGALAAMTSAWVASYLGVAGTIVGAAVGSLVASIATTVYVGGLHRGRTFITESGTVVSRSHDPDGEAPGEGTDVMVAQAEEVVGQEAAESAFSWRRVLTWSGLALVTALLTIGIYEVVTGYSFGNPDNPSISRPWRGPTPGPATGPTTDSPEPTATTPTPTSAVTTVPPTAPSTDGTDPTPPAENDTGPTDGTEPTPQVEATTVPTPEP